MDLLLTTMKRRFEQNKDIFNSMSQFSPKNFPSIVETIDAKEELAEKIAAFCDNYSIDSNECASELMSFAGIFGKFTESEVCEEDEESEDQEENENQDDEDPDSGNNEDDEPITVLLDKSYAYHNALHILANPKYHLVDAYPILYSVYGKILAIPFTSCTPERTFSVLKRVKNRLRSTISQDRLESLIMMSVERKILEELNVDCIIDRLGSSSALLSSMLIR